MKSGPAWWPGGRVQQNAARAPWATRAAALAAASAPAFTASQVPSAMGVPLSMEYSPSFATKLSGSTSLRRLRTGHTEGKGWTEALAASSASHCDQALCKKAR
ncbi:hypothetical protein D3C72_1575650 [compost metagenome]